MRWCVAGKKTGIQSNLETAVGRKKAVEDIGAPGEIKKVVVTLVVIRHFFILPGAHKSLCGLL
jgi:hypothetical protein